MLKLAVCIFHINSEAKRIIHYSIYRLLLPLELFIDCLGPEFFLGKWGSDCMLDELVNTESNCRYAAQMIRKDYMKDSKGQYFDRPAGCYYLTRSDDVHFNTITDPIATNNLMYGSNGVCARSMY